MKAAAPILRSHNKLTDLPAAALLQLPNLKTLKLAGNPPITTPATFAVDMTAFRRTHVGANSAEASEAIAKIDMVKLGVLGNCGNGQIDRALGLPEKFKDRIEIMK